MQTKDFDFELPEELIAQYPLDKRDESRLLHYDRKTKEIKHLQFKDIINLLQPGDVLVRNKTKVLPARLYLEPKIKNNPESKPIEVLLIKPKDNNNQSWEIIGKPFKKLKAGHKYTLTNGQEVEIEEEVLGRSSDELNGAETATEITKYINFGSEELFNQAIAEAGSMPIPPYMKRSAEELDKSRYQTIYADEDISTGLSIAAPTAGLHFTDEIFAELKAKGIEVLDLTLHVGMGTFLPIKTDNIKDHKMHSEFYSIEQETWDKITAAKVEGKRVIAVGSTSTRCLESIALNNTLQGSTDIYIYPGYQFQTIDGMITNFHLPKSSLILMVSALLGTEETMNIYEDAIKNEYRFYSYGDACFFV